MCELVILAVCCFAAWLLWRMFRAPKRITWNDSGYVILLPASLGHLMLCRHAWDGFVDGTDAEEEKLKESAIVYPTVEEAIRKRDDFHRRYKESAYVLLAADALKQLRATYVPNIHIGPKSQR